MSVNECYLFFSTDTLVIMGRFTYVSSGSVENILICKAIYLRKWNKTPENWDVTHIFSGDISECGI